MIASEIVQAALREGNLIPIGTDPTSAQMTEGMALLNEMLFSFFGNEIGEPLMEWMIPPPQQTSPVVARWPLKLYYPTPPNVAVEVWQNPPCNVRLMASNTEATTIYLQHLPNDGARVQYVNVGATADLVVNGNGRMVEGETEVTVAYESATQWLWFYRADLGNWILVEELDEDSDSPLPIEFNGLLRCGLAIMLASRYGLDPRQGTLMTYQNQLKKAWARYRQPTPVLGGSMQVPPTWQSYPNGLQVYGDML